MRGTDGNAVGAPGGMTSFNICVQLRQQLGLRRALEYLQLNERVEADIKGLKNICMLKNCRSDI